MAFEIFFAIPLFIFSTSIHTVVTWPTKLETEYARVDDELKNIPDPLKKIEKLRHLLVEERWQHQQTRNKYEEADLKANEAMKNVSVIEIDRNNKDDELKKMSVLFFFRIRLHHLQWTLVEDDDVKKEIAAQNVTVLVPTDIPDDGRQSFINCYRVWLAIMKVVARKPAEKTGENEDYVTEFKSKLVSVGLQPFPGNEEKYAAAVTYLINRLPGSYSKEDNDNSQVEWENEAAILKALNKWKIVGDQQRIARAVYRLKIM